VHNRHVGARPGFVWLLLACAGYAGYLVATRPPTPFTSPDTAVYIEGSPLVPIGYPLFLDSVGLDRVAVAQPVLFATALMALGLEVAALTGSMAFALVILTAIAGIPELWTYHVSLLTESLFMSGLAAFLAALTSFARQPSWRTLLLASLIAGVTASVRRTAYAFVPLLLLAALWPGGRHARRRSTYLAAAAVPLALLIAADYAATAVIHGSERTSLTGRHLFAKAALIEAPPVRPSGDAVDQQLQHALATTYQPIRDLIARAPSDLRTSLILYYETCLQGPCVSRLRESLALPEASLNSRLAEAGAARIRRAPTAFVWLTARHYVSFWTAYKTRHPETAQRLSAFIAKERPLPFERDAFRVEPGGPIAFAPSPAVRWLQPLILAAGILTAAVGLSGLVAVLRGFESPVLFAASAASLTAHACLLLSALAAAGISRFMVAVFPAVVVGGALGAWWLIHKWLGRPPGRTI
jgi:hypothetical protein